MSLPLISYQDQGTGTICASSEKTVFHAGIGSHGIWLMALWALLLTLIISSMAKIKQTQGTDDEVSSGWKFHQRFLINPASIYSPELFLIKKDF